MDAAIQDESASKAPAKKPAKPRAPRKKKEPVRSEEGNDRDGQGDTIVEEGGEPAAKGKDGKGAAGPASRKRTSLASASAKGGRQPKQAKKSAAGKDKDADDDADEEIIRVPLAAAATGEESAADLAPGDSAQTTAAPANQAAAGSGATVPANEEDEEELDDDVVAKPSQTIGREETKALLDTFDDITLSRYEVFRRAHLTKASMKKIVTSLVGPVPASVAIVVSGVGKVFVGEMVESALEIMDERGETGPIAPVHLREAFRRYQKRTGTIQNKLYSNHLFG